MKGEFPSRIIDAALRVFARNGYHKSRAFGIAREAGVASGAIYLSWPSVGLEESAGTFAEPAFI